MSGPQPLAGKVAVVTGGTRGIGRATVARLAQAGATVVLAARDAAAGAEIVAECRASGGIVSAQTVDVIDERQVKELYDHVADAHGRIDVCVNNAGAIVAGDADPIRTTAEAWRAAIEVNLTGAFLCIKHQLPHLIDAGGGSIVNVSGTAALLGSATPQSGYDAAKAGLLALTRDVAVTYAASRIRCNAVCPGPIEGPLIEQLVRDERTVAARLSHIPAGRFGLPGEVAEAITFLSSDASSWTTGASFPVDGGISIAYNTSAQT